MMNRLLRTQISRSWTTYILAGILVISSVIVSGSPAFAALPCNPGQPIDASSSPASCDMNISVSIGSGALLLANDSSANVPGSPFIPSGSSTLANFNFSNVVKDHRGLATGWILQAASAGIAYGANSHMQLNLTTLSSSSCASGQVCPAATFTPATLSATPASPFLSVGSGSVVDGDYENVINGSFTLPAGLATGSYSGTITMTLLNAF